MASPKPGKLGHSLSWVDCLVEFAAMFCIRLPNDPAELSCVRVGFGNEVEGAMMCPIPS